MDAPGWRLVQVRKYTHSEKNSGQKVQSEKVQVRKYSQRNDTSTHRSVHIQVEVETMQISSLLKS